MTSRTQGDNRPARNQTIRHVAVIELVAYTVASEWAMLPAVA
jgi:hypothetical protein